MVLTGREGGPPNRTILTRALNLSTSGGARKRDLVGHDGDVSDRLPAGTFVVVSGPPASGKTTPVEVGPLVVRIRAAVDTARHQ